MATKFWKHPGTTFYELILVKLQFFSKKKMEKKQIIAKTRRSMKIFFFVFNKQWKKKTFEEKYTFIERGLEMEGNNSNKILKTLLTFLKTHNLDHRNK